MRLHSVEDDVELLDPGQKAEARHDPVQLLHQALPGSDQSWALEEVVEGRVAV